LNFFKYSISFVTFQFKQFLTIYSFTAIQTTVTRAVKTAVKV